MKKYKTADILKDLNELGFGQLMNVKDWQGSDCQEVNWFADAEHGFRHSTPFTNREEKFFWVKVLWWTSYRLAPNHFPSRENTSIRHHFKYSDDPDIKWFLCDVKRFGEYNFTRMEYKKKLRKLIKYAMKKLKLKKNVEWCLKEFYPNGEENAMVYFGLQRGQNGTN